MIRVVLDTNIVVSALLQPLGPSANVLLLTLSGTVRMCLSGATFAEYEEVLQRPRFQLKEEVIGSALDAIRSQAQWTRPTHPVRVCSDPDDDIFLECAQAAGANYLVTGNVKDFPARWFDTEVVTPRRFLELVAGRL